MELENFKNTWEQFDAKLNENLKLNEKLLKRLNFGNTKNEMQKLLVTEQLNIVGTFLAFVFFTAHSLRLIDEVQFSVPGLVGSLLLLVYLFLSVIKVKSLLKVNYYDASIVGLQKSLSKIKVQILRFRRIEYLLIPFVMFSIWPIAFISLADINIYERLDQVWVQISLLLGFAITVVLGILVNRLLYDRKIENAEDFLKEITQFEVSE